MFTFTRKAGTTDVSVVIRIIDAADGTPETGVEHNTAGIDLSYRREGAVDVDLTEVALSALSDAHADGGIEHIGDGYYRIDLPDAAGAAGSTGVLVHGTITGMIVIGCYVQLVAYVPRTDLMTILTEYGTETTMTTTALQSLASSATTGWQSAVVDNTSDLFLDALVQVVLDFANTAPGSDKAAYVYAYGGLTSTYTNPVTGTEGTITLTTIVTTQPNIKLLGVIAYNTTDEVVESQPMSVAAAFGGLLPPKWGLVIMNYSGAALAASGNTVKYRGILATQS